MGKPTRWIRVISVRTLLISLVVSQGVAAEKEDRLVVSDDVQAQARQMLNHAGVNRGLIVLLDPDPAELAVALAQQSELTIYTQLPPGSASVELRRRLDRAGLLGTRVYVTAGDWSHLHLANNLADAVLVTSAASDVALQHETELLRVCRPLGKLLVGNVERTKPYPAGADDWTHPYHGPDNNPQSLDRLARFPYVTQFLAEPYFVPFPEVTVTASGRIFKAFGHIAFKQREWPWLNSLIAINGYNGTLLWRRELEPGYIIHRNTMIATDQTLYVGDGTSCKLINTSTGELTGEIKAPPGSSGSAWKWMAIVEGVLYAMLGESEPPVETLRKNLDRGGWPWDDWEGFRLDDYQTGLGRTLCAFDLSSRELLWMHSEMDQLDGRSIAMKDERIYFYSHSTCLAAVDAKSGQVIWRNSDRELLDAIGQFDKAQHAGKGFFTSAFMKCSEEAIYFAGPQLNHLVAASAQDGHLLWKYEPTGNFQLVLRDEGLYALGYSENAKKFDPLTGEILVDLGFRRQACTRATGTADMIYCRSRFGGTTQLSVKGDTAKRFALMRPACHDGVIAAGGLFYWGPWMCDCNLQIIGFVGMSPAGDLKLRSEATESERLVGGPHLGESVQPISVTSSDWPAYRADNQRNSASQANVPRVIQQCWQSKLPDNVQPIPPITAGGLVFHSGSDGTVRSFNAQDGELCWKLYTGGRILFPPTVADGRLLVGSGDGWIYAVEATTGRELWRFRAAPAERKIIVHGRLVSTWPVGSGVLVHEGVVYAAAGIASHDGTHVYALDVATGALRWQNNTSGQLGGPEGTNGVSVQGHLLLHEKRLYLAGGNTVSPAIYDIEDGRCLSTLEDESQASSRGRELFLIDDKVTVLNQRLYGQNDYPREKVKDLVQADNGEVLIRGSGGRLVRIDRRAELDDEVKGIWDSKQFKQISALALGNNAVVVAGSLAVPAEDSLSSHAVVAMSVEKGETIWSYPLPAKPVYAGVALDAGGRVHVATEDGQVLCLAAQTE